MSKFPWLNFLESHNTAWLHHTVMISNEASAIVNTILCSNVETHPTCNTNHQNAWLDDAGCHSSLTTLITKHFPQEQVTLTKNDWITDLDSAHALKHDNGCLSIIDWIFYQHLSSELLPACLCWCSHNKHLPCFSLQEHITQGIKRCQTNEWHWLVNNSS